MSLIFLGVFLIVTAQEQEAIVGGAGPGREVFRISREDSARLHAAEAWNEQAKENLARVRAEILAKFGEATPDPPCQRKVTHATLFGDYVVRITETENTCAPPIDQ